MFNAVHDGAGPGADVAIPSMGLIEGRITVLEVIAVTCLRLVMHNGDRAANSHIAALVERAMREKCTDIKLSMNDKSAALDYARDLIQVTIDNVDFGDTAPRGR